MFLSILIPCLNEEETVGVVIKNAQEALNLSGLFGEIIVIDNGSTDKSASIAKSLGAVTLNVSEIGYGSALKSGINECKGEFAIMLDADASYSLDDMGVFVSTLNEGYDLVIGNRFSGGISPGAMPLLHRYLGNPILSWLGRLLFKTPIGDFHCGLRAFRTDAIRKLNLKSTGMEFASEMIVKASLNGLKIAEVPTTLKPDGRSRAPHLRTWRDGWRHLIFLLTASPRFLFLYPGITLSVAGLIGFLLTFSGVFEVFNLLLSSNTYLLSIGLTLAGLQLIMMAIVARIYSINLGNLPKGQSVARFLSHFTLERGIVLGLFLITIGIAGFTILFLNWNGAGFDSFSSTESLRMSGAIMLATLSGIQILFASFFASMIQ